MAVQIQKSERFTLKQMRLWSRNKFDFNKEYQRSKVWDTKRKQRLIDSIIKDLSIGILFLKKSRNKFEVLDGQQRIQCIFDFIEGEFKTSPEYTKEFPEKSYMDLEKNPNRSADFDAFKICYDLVHGGTEDEIADIFLRLQEGISLNVPEKLNALLGKMRNFVVEISKHSFFKQGIKVNEYRFAHRMLAAQIILLEFETKFDCESPEFPNLRFVSLKKMYEDYKPRVPQRFKRNIRGALDFLHRSLGEDARVIRLKSDVPLVYILVSFLCKRYVTSNILNKFKEFIIDFFLQVEQTKATEGQVNDNPFIRYAVLRSKGLTPEGFAERFKLLLQGFLAEVPQIRLKDNKKLFDVGQKLVIYYRDKKICQYCKKEVSWEDAGFHHIKFRGSGGLTTIENGQSMHKDCHIKFHKKKGLDNDIE